MELCFIVAIIVQLLSVFGSFFRSFALKKSSHFSKVSTTVSTCSRACSPLIYKKSEIFFLFHPFFSLFHSFSHYFTLFLIISLFFFFIHSTVLKKGEKCLLSGEKTREKSWIIIAIMKQRSWVCLKKVKTEEAILHRRENQQ